MSWWSRVLLAHRSSDTTGAAEVKEFFFPRPEKAFFIRLGIVSAVAVVVFKFILLPCVIDGESMMPTYTRKGFTFCWRARYLFSKPKYGDVVIIRYDNDVYYLKRIVGLPGDVIFFSDGTLYRNGKPVSEKYLHYVSFWYTRPTRVKPGYVYAVGDNRSEPSRLHKFGQLRISRIAGSPLP
jgi:signal peptidase I